MALTELYQSIASGLNEASRKPNILNYSPGVKQLAFHKDTSIGRLFVGGNRSGKTVAGITEDIWWLTGTHPYQETPEPPVQGRVITVDFKSGANMIIIPALKQWIPKSYLRMNSWEKSWDKDEHILTLRNGSTLEIKSHDQDLETFAGSSRHFLHVDEECPRTIFTESKIRLIDFNGHYWLTMTPVEGLTWVYEDMVETPRERIHLFESSVHDNPILSDEGKAAILEDLSEEDRRIREHGAFVPKGGLVLREFKYQENVLDEGIPPKRWQWWVSLDPGYNNPTAILWHAIRPEDGTVITFDEHYQAEWTVAMHSEEIKKRNEYYAKKPYLYVGDPAMAQRQQTTGLSVRMEYVQNDINVALGNKDVKAGIDKMNDYLRLRKWFITKSCPNLLREIRQYRWKTFQSSKIADLNNKREEPQKKNDHAVDSCRYLFTFMPDLRPLKLDNKPLPDKVAIAELMQPGTVYDPKRLRVFPWQVDPNLDRRRNPPVNVGWGEVL